MWCITYWQEQKLLLEDPQGILDSVPIGAVWGFSPGLLCGTREVSLGHGVLWQVFASDVKQSIRYTRIMGTVKMTYRSLVFFCSNCVCSGVSRCLGNPPGGLCRWKTSGWDVRRHWGRWPCSRVYVLNWTSTLCSVGPEPPSLTNPSPSWTSLGLVGCVHILLSGEVNGTA